jgi:phospholipase C
MKRVVILMQENKTPDFYFPTLSSWGAMIPAPDDALVRAKPPKLPTGL